MLLALEGLLLELAEPVWHVHPLEVPQHLQLYTYMSALGYIIYISVRVYHAHVYSISLGIYHVHVYISALG